MRQISNFFDILSKALRHWNKFEWTFDENSCQFCYYLFPVKFVPAKSKKRINFNWILFEVKITWSKKSVQKRVFQQGKPAHWFFLMFVANEVQLMKANVQSVVVSFVQNERNILCQKDVIHLLICDKDRIFFFLGRSFSPKIFCLCVHSPLCQA